VQKGYAEKSFQLTTSSLNESLPGTPHPPIMFENDYKILQVKQPTSKNLR
jgi:hypothetical protein